MKNMVWIDNEVKNEIIGRLNSLNIKFDKWETYSETIVTFECEAKEFQEVFVGIKMKHYKVFRRR